MPEKYVLECSEVEDGDTDTEAGGEEDGIDELSIVAAAMGVMVALIWLMERRGRSI